MSHRPQSLRVSAVSYLNTSPLVWGLLHGPQQGVFDLRFELPSECADSLKAGACDVGHVPVIELARQPDLTPLPGTSIACDGPVRSILLIARKPWADVKTVAADAGSRTSVILSRIVLARRFGCRPEMLVRRADLDAMLAEADAALVIGDPALRIDPAMREWRGAPVDVLDLGAEWAAMTGLPMVFAVWAAKTHVLAPGLARIFADSLAFGEANLGAIVAEEAPNRDLPRDLVRRYLTEHIRYGLGEREQEGVRRYFAEAAALGLIERAPELNFASGTEAVVR